MGKREVRVIAVPKGVSAALLVVATAAMVWLFYLLAQHAYLRPAGSSGELLDRAIDGERAGTISLSGLVATLWPVIANVLLFIPWGFLAFVVIDRPERRRPLTYGIVIAAGLVFTAAIQLWQTFLPAQVSAMSDAAANIAGVFLGAIAGNLRKQVRVHFEV